MTELRTTLTRAQRDILARDTEAALVVAPVGVGKTFMGVTRALEFIKEKGFVLFLATNLTNRKEQLDMLHKLDVRGKRRIVVTTQHAFFQLWGKGRGRADDLGENFVEAFESTRGLDVVIVVDEAHMLFIEKRGTKAAKLRAFVDRFPWCRVVGITATPNLDAEDRVARCALVFGGAPRILTVPLGGEEHAAIMRELPFTPLAVRVSEEGVPPSAMGDRAARALYTMLSLHAAGETRGCDGLPPLDEVRQVTRELVADQNNTYLVSALVDDVLRHPCVELQPLTSVLTRYLSGKVKDGASSGHLTSVVSSMSDYLDFDTPQRDGDLPGGGGARTLEEPGATKSGRIVAIFSSVSNSALRRFGEVLQQTLVEHRHGPEDTPQFKIVNAFGPFLGDIIADLAKEAREEKTNIYILCAPAYMTGTNALCGVVDTVVEHGTFSESTRTQLVGRISCRPVTACRYMPRRTVHVFTASPLQAQVDEHLRKCAQADGTRCVVDPDAMTTRKRSRATASGYKYAEKQLPAYATLRKHVADCGFQYVREHADQAIARMRDLKKELNVELMNARQERGYEHTLQCTVAYCSVEDDDDDGCDD